MTVSRSLEQLDRAWAASHAAANALRLTLQEDIPIRDTLPGPPPKPVEAAAELATDIAALLGAGSHRLVDGVVMAKDDAGLEALDVVSVAQDRWLEAAERLDTLIGARRLLELGDFVRRHGGEWHGWWRSVLKGLDAIVAARREIEVCLAECWRDLSERPQVHVERATVGRLRVREVSPLVDSPGAAGETSEPLPATRVPSAPIRGDG